MPAVPEYFNPTELLLDRHNNKHPDKVAVIADGVGYSYSKMTRLVCRAANALVGFGLEPGDRAMIFSTDSIESLSMWLGALRAGIVPAWIPPAYPSSDLLHFVDEVSPKLLFTDQASKQAEVEAELAKRVKHIVTEADGYATQSDTFTPFQKHRDDICYFFFSGGTTGRSKGVVHLTSDFIHVPDRHSKFLGWDAKDVHYATSTKAFTHGIWPGMLIPLYNGASAIITSKKLSVDIVVEQLQERRPSVLITVPTVLKWLVVYPDERGKVPDLGSLRMITSASEPLPAVIQEKFRKVYGLEIFDSIGSSEITYEWLSNRPGANRPGSCGKPIFGVEVKLMDPAGSGEISEPSRPGELWVKSATNFLFYWRRAEKSRQTIVGEWVRTGDVLYFDGDGFFYHTGRTDDLFKVHGMWVSPVDIEKALLEHGAVRDAAVVAWQDADGLTYPKAFVVLGSSTISDELIGELQEFVRKRLGGYRVPKWIEALDELPRTALQKISRASLRKGA